MSLTTLARVRVSVHGQLVRDGHCRLGDLHRVHSDAELVWADPLLVLRIEDRLGAYVFHCDVEETAVGALGEGVERPNMWFHGVVEQREV